MAYRILLFLFTCLIIIVLSEKHKNYGSFNLALTRVDICKGPKKRDCTEFRMKINNSVIIDFDVLVHENLSPNKGKVLAITNGNEGMRLQINKPCENLFVKPVLMKLYNATNSCVIKKGHYIFSLDFQEILRAYYGGMHLYGLYAFKAMLYGDQCNFSCTIIEVRISGNNYVEVILQIGSIGLVIAAAGLWAGAGVTMRPKHRDEQTLVGGTLWSQTIIPIGLMISKIVDEQIDLFIEGYYLVVGILLLWTTGILLIVHETRTYKRRQQRLRAHTSRDSNTSTTPPIKYDKAYYTIGVFCLLAGVVKMTELIVFVILAKEELEAESK